MNAVVSQLNSVAALWWDLIVRAAWQGAIVLAAVWVVSRYVPAIPPACKVWLWRVAFLKLLVGIAWFTPLPLPVLPVKTPQFSSPALSVIEEPVELSAQPAAAVSVGGPQRSATDWRTWLIAVWTVGLLLGVIRLQQHWRSARKIRCNAVRVEDPVVLDALVQLSRALHLRRVPMLRQSPAVCSPVVIGLLRPVVVLPLETLNGKAEHLKLMLAHELAHIRRRDVAWLWLFAVCELVFFFHPLVWLARREWAVSTESACDQLALRAVKSAPHDYGSMLVDVASRMAGVKTPALAAGMFETVSTLKRRLKAMTTKRNPWFTAVGVVLVAAAAVSVVPFRLVAQTPDAEALARLKEENVKLRQELEATRAEMESIRAAKQREARGQARRANEQLSQQFQQHHETARRLSEVQKQLESLTAKLADSHPDVIAKRHEMIRLLDQLQMDARVLADQAAAVKRPGQNIVPAKPEEVERSQERRALLAKEIELAEKQAEFVRRNLEVGKDIAENLLRVQREVLDLKLRQAEMNGSKAEWQAALMQHVQVAEQLLKEMKKRIEAGVIAPGAELAFEREVLRLKRELSDRQ